MCNQKGRSPFHHTLDITLLQHRQIWADHGCYGRISKLNNRPARMAGGMPVPAHRSASACQQPAGELRGTPGAAGPPCAGSRPAPRQSAAAWTHLPPCTQAGIMQRTAEYSWQVVWMAARALIASVQ